MLLPARSPASRHFCRDAELASRSLLAVNPEVAAQWHPTKNMPIGPGDIFARSAQKAWWVCPNHPEHVWEAPLYDRISHGSGCPFCSGNRVHESTCLANLLPDLAAQWHPTLNGDLTPRDVTTSSNVRVWWSCPEGEDHVYAVKISHRATGNGKGTGCPFCANLRVSVTNNLAKFKPFAAEQWHPTKNGDLTPKDVVAGSHKTYWFVHHKTGEAVERSPKSYKFPTKALRRQYLRNHPRWGDAARREREPGMKKRERTRNEDQQLPTHPTENTK